MEKTKNRSRKGCWTCKRRRKKCDEGRPTCQVCQKLGVDCEGYGTRLTWGVGIASRGRLSGALTPTSGICSDSLLQESARQRPSPSRATSFQHYHRYTPTSNSDNGGHKLDRGINTPSPLPADLDQGSNDSYHPSPASTSQFSRASYSTSSSLEDMVALKFPDWDSNSLEDRLLSEFFDTGHLSLFSTRASESPVIPVFTQLCRRSAALRSVCLAFQVQLSDYAPEIFLNFYDRALRKFRAQLLDGDSMLEDGTLMAGALLCTVGMCQGLQWTMHLGGLDHLIAIRGGISLVQQPTGLALHAIEVMAVMDLPTFVVGRQTPYLGLWRRYRLGYHNDREDDESALEPVTGAPRSLLDIFCGIQDEPAEEQFWNWTGHMGEYVQIQLWEAYRISGILNHRGLRRRCSSMQSLSSLSSPTSIVAMSSTSSSSTPDEHQAGFPSLGDGVFSYSPINPVSSTAFPSKRPNNKVLVGRLLSHLDAIWQAVTSPGKTGDLQVMNALLYPVFTAAVHIRYVQAEADGRDRNRNWKEFIQSLFEALIEDNESLKFLRIAWKTVKEIWQRQDDTDADEICREWGVELGLY